MDQSTLDTATQMSDQLFGALLHLHMVNDPDGTVPIDHAMLESELSAESKRRGYDGWVDAYHRFTQ